MRARTRNKASLPSSDLPRAEERPMSSATCLRACRRPKTGPEVGSGKATASSSPRRRRRKASMRRRGQEVIGNGAVFDLAVFAERLAKEDGRRRGAVGDFRDVHVFIVLRNITEVNTYYTYYMTTFSFTIDTNSFQANDLLEKDQLRSVRCSSIRRLFPRIPAFTSVRAI